jgi:undecaprenyl-diphosphatase
MFELIKSLILGIVEGLTEFLPISSTGHLIILNQWISFSKPFTEMFDVVIQLGAILAAVIFFRAKLWPFGKEGIKKEVVNTWSKSIVAVVPALFLGFLLHHFIEEKLFNPITVAVALVLGGIVLIFVEKKSRTEKITSIAQMSYQTAFTIGIIQCLALIPGTSRSAATIIGALLLGASRVVATEFSFFLAIPTMCAATAFTLLKNGFAITKPEFLILLVGFLTSFAVASAVITVFMKYIKTKNFIPFGYYRIVLGVLVLIYSIAQAIR